MGHQTNRLIIRLTVTGTVFFVGSFYFLPMLLVTYYIANPVIFLAHMEVHTGKVANHSDCCCFGTGNRNEQKNY
jgi:hypothetical protein